MLGVVVYVYYHFFWTSDDGGKMMIYGQWQNDDDDDDLRDSETPETRRERLVQVHQQNRPLRPVLASDDTWPIFLDTLMQLI